MSKKDNSLTYQDYVRGIQKLKPDQQLSLVEIITSRLRKNLQVGSREHRITELEGLGAEIWTNLDIEEYLRGERKSWD